MSDNLQHFNYYITWNKNHVGLTKVKYSVKAINEYPNLQLVQTYSVPLLQKVEQNSEENHRCVVLS